MAAANYYRSPLDYPFFDITIKKPAKPPSLEEVLQQTEVERQVSAKPERDWTSWQKLESSYTPFKIRIDPGRLRNGDKAVMLVFHTGLDGFERVQVYEQVELLGESRLVRTEGDFCGMFGAHIETSGPIMVK